MSVGLELQIAYRFFKSKAKDKFISIISMFSIIGIILGVATLIVVMSVMNGYEKELIDRISGIDGDVVVTNYTADGFAKVETALLKSGIEVDASIEHIIRQTDGEGLLLGANNVASAVAVRGIDIENIVSKQIISQNITHGSLNGYMDSGILIGPALALKLGVNVGSSVKLISPNGTQSLVGYVPKFKTFKVVGIFNTGMYEHNLGTVFISSKYAGLMFEKLVPNKIEIKLLDESKLEIFTKKLHTILDGTGAVVLHKYQLNNHLREALRVERVVMYLILTLIIVVAAFNIISSLIILVKDKSKNIAILKTYGLSNSSISKIFVISGSIIGVFGSIIGSIIGILFVLNIENLKELLESFTGLKLFNPVIYYLTNLPSQIDWFGVVMVIVTSLLLTIFATLYPSYRACRLNPVVILRNE